MARKKTHSGNMRKSGNDNRDKSTENGTVKAGIDGVKKGRNSGISVFLLAFIVVAVSSVAITYLSDDINSIFGTIIKSPTPEREKEPVKSEVDTQTVVTAEDEKLSEQARSNSKQSTFQNEEAQSSHRTPELRVETETQSKDKQTGAVNEKSETVTQSAGKKTVAQSEQTKDASGSEENLKPDLPKDEPLQQEKIKLDETQKTERIDENEESKKEKQKAKRKEYAKYNITNSADYKIRKKLDEADRLLEQNKLEEAMRKYDEILKTNPDSPRALWGRGLVYDKQAEQQRSNQLLEEELAVLDKALYLPRVPDELLLMIGQKLAERQQFRGWSGKAASTWKFLVTKFPEKLELQRQWGVSYLMVGQNEKARNVFQQILNKRPDDGFALVHLGFIVKVIDNNPQEGIPLLQAGIDSDEPGTNEGKFFFHLGDGYLRINQTDKASQVYKLGAKRGLFLSEHQRSLYNVDTLTGRPWWKAEQTPYQTHLKLLEKNWKTIRDEGLAQLDHSTGSFLPEEENLREKGDWKQFTLYSRGRKHEDNCRKTPQTCALIDQIPDAKGCKRGQVKYSVMHPGVHVWPHCGPTNCRIRAHLGLVVPDGPRIRVVDDTRTWKEGKFIIFDDSFEHEVWHDGKESRLVLIVDFWHPELTAQQKRSLSPI